MEIEKRKEKEKRTYTDNTEPYKSILLVKYSNKYFLSAPTLFYTILFDIFSLFTHALLPSFPCNDLIFFLFEKMEKGGEGEGG